MGRRGQCWEGGDSDGKEGTVMGRNKLLLSSEKHEHVPNIFF